MKFIRQLKKSLTLNLKEKSIRVKITLIGFIIGLCIVIIFSVIFGFIFKSFNVPESIFLGFMPSYLLFADTVFYMFKHIKNLNVFKINFILIKDLLIVLIFFIIINKVVKINFVFAGIGITIMPISAVIMVLFYRSDIKLEN